MIRTVVFDIGRVLIGASWKNYVRTRTAGEAELQALEYIYWESGLWNARDLGVMTEAEIYDRLRARAEEVDSVALFEDIEAHLGELVTRKDYAVEWVRELKRRGYRVLYLSNYGRRLMQANWQVLDFLPLMDGGIFSCDVKLIKPDPAIYALLRDSWSLHPEQTVFIDDRAENVAAAEEMGFRGLRFTGYEETHAALEAMLRE